VTNNKAEISLPGMSLKQQIQDNLKEAMKNKDAFALGVLRMVVTSVKNKEIEKRMKLAKSGEVEKLEELSQLADEEIIGVLSTEIKRRKDAAKEFEAGGRPELAEKELKESEFLMKYMPEQISEGEIRKIIIEAIQKTGAVGIKEIGKVMGVIMPQVKGKADGELVNKIVREELGKEKIS
jgi:uncharacterized protein YqeY